MSDRILVLCEGRLTGELDIGEATQRKIMQYSGYEELKIKERNTGYEKNIIITAGDRTSDAWSPVPVFFCFRQ